MFVQGYFVIVKDWKQLKFLSVECLKKNYGTFTQYVPVKKK